MPASPHSEATAPIRYKRHELGLEKNGRPHCGRVRLHPRMKLFGAIAKRLGSGLQSDQMAKVLPWKPVKE